MPIDGGDKRDEGRAIDAALSAALEDLTGRGGDVGPDAVDYRWLGIGIELGLRRPERGRALLALMAAQEKGEPGTDDTPEPASIPVASALLARAATLPASARTGAVSEAAFGWVTRLAPGEILLLGQVVGEMLAAGSPSDVGKGFGIAWSVGDSVSRDELEAMLDEFTELEITVGGILAQRDLRTGRSAERPQGIAAWLGDWMPRSRPEERQATEAIERNGEAARRGLVALWNVWMAMRYRTRIEPPVFDLLVHPWVTVVGPLPE
ncbi:MAG: hypothetical protein OEV61_09455 [Chloroflexota bacterium]|jgi:hypothetical protein|nr:hypothetical protein [Chloroflexota bacterium]